MINAYNAKSYCCEDISLIENYKEAVPDQKRMWDIHHRILCDDEGRTLFTKKQLIEMNLYHNRPASELMFVTRSIHNKLHREMHSKGGKKNSIHIFQFSKSGEIIQEWPSINEAYCKLGISQGNICSCLKGYRKSAGGFVWKYKDSLQ